MGKWRDFSERTSTLQAYLTSPIRLRPGVALRMTGDPDQLTVECRSVVEESVLRHMGDSVSLSGGLDTAIIAHIAARHSNPKCYTVALALAPAPDIKYARSVARRLGLDWELVELRLEDLPDRLTDVVRVLKTFDPMEVRNSVAVYHGLLAAKADGFSKVMTGDAADELFAGYSFSFNTEPAKLMKKLRSLWRVMRFSSEPMASSLGIEASLPYLDRRVVRFAKGLSADSLVGERKGKRFGKLILRVAYEDMIGRRIAWRVKTPIEYGSGTTSLSVYYSAKIDDDTFDAGRASALGEGVKIRDKEHFAYYRLYRELFPPPGATAKMRFRCPCCGGDAMPGSTFCVTCGAYPIRAVNG